MTKNTSIILIAAVAGIMIAGALAVAMPSAAFGISIVKETRISIRKEILPQQATVA